MAFYPDPRKALDALVAEPVDVVVSDARMPHLSGEALLRELSKRSPGTARVVLSGQAEISDATRLLGVAHQYLAKPCDPAQLAEVINRVARVRQKMDDAAVRALITTGDQLPTAPSVWSELTRLLASDRAQIAEVVKVLEHEPVLAAKVLKISNSAYFGVAQEVVSLSRAVMVLGLETLRAMILVLETEKAFPSPGVDLDRLRSRSLVAAQIARSFSPNGPVADATFTAALVADLGAILLATKAKERFLELWRRGATHEEEEAVLGISHPLAGAWLLSLWGVPSSVADMVALHHLAPVEQSPSSPPAAVWLAIALLDAWERQPDGPLPPAVETYVIRHGLGDSLGKARAIFERGGRA
jgi:HD-like signal output (HDOD) protein